VDNEFIAEFGKVALQTPHGSITKGAEAFACNKASDMLHQFQVFIAPTTGLDT
jgi:hypothetical protein